MVSESALRLGERLPPAAFRTYRQRAIFEACKWDIQINDHCALGDRALLIEADAWAEIAGAASCLAGELFEAEHELLAAVREGRLPGLDRKTRRRLERLPLPLAPGGPGRLIRFDFHLCDGRWFISEANCDVPGGLNEASQMPKLWPEVSGLTSPGDPTAAYAEDIVAVAGTGPVALVHATSFSDDWQMLKYLANALEAKGVEAIAAAPDGFAWKDGEARAKGARIGAIVRFFPGDWLVHTSFARAWFTATQTPVLNPVVSLLAQNKAFPLFLDALGIEAPAWRQYLPEVRPVSRRRLFDADTVLKPVYGRVGEGVAIAGVSAAKTLRNSRLAAALHPRHWIRQQRFAVSNLGTAEDPAFPTVGIYTLGSRVIGAYGRVGSRPMIDMDALDVPVFITGAATGEGNGSGRTLQ